jgi:site-specific recombinase XerD
VEGSIDKDVTTIAAACDLFLKDCESRFLSGATVGKYKLLFRELKAQYGPWHLKALSTAELDACRGEWKLSPISARKKLERLRTFFKFCVDRDLLRKNPAALLKPPQARLTPTLPFTDEDMEKISTQPRRTRSRESTARRTRKESAQSYPDYMKVNAVTPLRTYGRL